MFDSKNNDKFSIIESNGDVKIINFNSLDKKTHLENIQKYFQSVYDLHKKYEILWQLRVVNLENHVNLRHFQARKL